MRRAMTSQTNPHGWTGDPEARWGAAFGDSAPAQKGSLGNILPPAPTRGIRQRPAENGRLPPARPSPVKPPSSRYAAGPRKPLTKPVRGPTISAYTKRGQHGAAMINRLPHPHSPDRTAKSPDGTAQSPDINRLRTASEPPPRRAAGSPPRAGKRPPGEGCRDRAGPPPGPGRNRTGKHPFRGQKPGLFRSAGIR